MTKISRHDETMSFAPPLPGSRTLGSSGGPMKLVFTLPNRSTCAAPTNPWSKWPPCAIRNTSTIPVSIDDPCAPRISFVEMGSFPRDHPRPDVPALQDDREAGRVQVLGEDAREQRRADAGEDHVAVGQEPAPCDDHGVLGGPPTGHGTSSSARRCCSRSAPAPTWSKKPANDPASCTTRRTYSRAPSSPASSTYRWYRSKCSNEASYRP